MGDREERVPCLSPGASVGPRHPCSYLGTVRKGWAKVSRKKPTKKERARALMACDVLGLPSRNLPNVELWGFCEMNVFII